VGVRVHVCVIYMIFGPIRTELNMERLNTNRNDFNRGRQGLGGERRRVLFGDRCGGGGEVCTRYAC
jgi:hypothetical protein